MTEKEEQILNYCVKDEKANPILRNLCSLTSTTVKTVDVVEKHTNTLEEHHDTLHLISKNIEYMHDINKRLSNRVVWLEIIATVLMVSIVILTVVIKFKY